MDTNAILDEGYKTALDAAVEASRHILRYWPSPLNNHFDKNLVMRVFDKNIGTGNYATIADTESEEIILKKIRSNPVLKDHGILAEESGNVNSNSTFQWVIDPIDGTLNFKNGLKDFGISIGLIHENESVLGVIALPAHDQILVARKGQFAKLLSFTGKELLDLKKTAYTEPINKALIAFDEGYENRSDQLKSGAERIADKVGYCVSYASSVISNYRIAMGHIGAYFHQTPTKYDVGAATIIISESGGVVTDLHGNQIDWTAPDISYLAAGNVEIHKKLLDLLR